LFPYGQAKDLSASHDASHGIMPSKEFKITKQAAASTTRDVIFTIPETLEIIRKPGIATIYGVIMAVYTNGWLTICGIKKHKDKITCKKLGS